MMIKVTNENLTMTKKEALTGGKETQKAVNVIIVTIKTVISSRIMKIRQSGVRRIILVLISYYIKIA